MMTMKKTTQTQTSSSASNYFTDPVRIKKLDVIMAKRHQEWDDLCFFLAVSPNHLRTQFEQGKFTDEN